MVYIGGLRSSGCQGFPDIAAAKDHIFRFSFYTCISGCSSYIIRIFENATSCISYALSTPKELWTFGCAWEETFDATKIPLFLCLFFLGETTKFTELLRRRLNCLTCVEFEHVLDFNRAVECLVLRSRSVSSLSWSLSFKVCLCNLKSSLTLESTTFKSG